MILLLIVLGIAFGEIYLSIKIGASLGAFRTVMILLGVAVVGLFLAKLEVFALMKRIEAEFKANASMTDAAIELVFVVFGAILLFVPGVITDVLAFLFIIPPPRAYFAARVSPNFRRKIEEVVEKKRAEFLAKKKS